MNPLTQFKKTRILRLLIAPALVALIALTAVPARATPSCGFSSTNLLAPVPAGYFPSGLLDLMCNDLPPSLNLPAWLLVTKVYGDSDLYVTKNTWAPGGRTGWHTHPGPSLVTVIEGTLTVYEAANPTCTPKIYTAGQSFTA